MTASRAVNADHAFFLAQLRALAPITDDVFAAIAAITVPRAFATGDWLLRAGDRAEWCYFVTRGLVRELYIGEQGQEHTRSFVGKGALTGSLLDLLSAAPSVTWIQALAPTTTLAWRYREFDALCERFPALHRVARRTAELVYVRKARREHEMLATTAAERYARWRAEHAAIDAVVTRRQLASYLGITPEHLSRLTRPTARGRTSTRPARARRGNT